MGRVFICFLGALLCVAAHAVDLTPCPDCDQPVSPRAVMCPQCGCPGEAIKAAVAAREATERPPPVYPVATFKVGSTEGAAVDYTDGEYQYLLIDAYPLMGATSLDITPLTTNAPIPYHSMQVAAEAPLVRFKTAATNLTFLTRSPPKAVGEDALMWLHTDGHMTPSLTAVAPPRSAVALLDSQTNLVAVIGHALDQAPVCIPLNTTWIDIGPRLFRDQTTALQAAQHDVATGSITSETMKTLRETRWTTPFFHEAAAKLTKLSETKGSP